MAYAQNGLSAVFRRRTGRGPSGIRRSRSRGPDQNADSSATARAGTRKSSPSGAKLVRELSGARSGWREEKGDKIFCGGKSKEKRKEEEPRKMGNILWGQVHKGTFSAFPERGKSPRKNRIRRRGSAIVSTPRSKTVKSGSLIEYNAVNRMRIIGPFFFGGPAEGFGYGEGGSAQEDRGIFC